MEEDTVNSKKSSSIKLPKLMQNNSKSKMANNINTGKFGGGATGQNSVSQTRQSSVMKMNDASMMIGDKSVGLGIPDLSQSVITESK
jgi:hypothetical protein